MPESQLTRVEQIREDLAAQEAILIEDVEFLLAQYDSAVKILAEAEKIVPGLISTAGRLSL